MRKNNGTMTLLMAMLMFAAACEKKSEPVDDFTVPEGFTVTVFADSLAPNTRHIVVNDNGDVYVSLSRFLDGKGIIGLRDTNGDGKADMIQPFGNLRGTGLDIRNGYLYFSPETTVVRYRLDGELVPTGEPETVVAGLPALGNHRQKTFAFDNAGNLFVNVGSTSNACQQQARTPGSMGQDPCPELEHYAGIWRFRADDLNQSGEQGHHFAKGIRNAVALDWNNAVGQLYAVQHGRDQLNTLWPELFTDEQNAELPAEEFLLVKDGGDYGWPYCYYDHFQGTKVLAPEYGGDGKKTGRCEDCEDPILAFPGHWAPNDLIFYDGDQFPERYKNGAFVAFHGSWNRAPKPQAGYNIAFVPFDGELPAGDYEIFAQGFAGTENLDEPGAAEHRPCGLAQGPDGSLYIADSRMGRIWKVSYGN
jgi:glucose/arabinose dehydrogenase